VLGTRCRPTVQRLLAALGKVAETLKNAKIEPDVSFSEFIPVSTLTKKQAYRHRIR